MTREKTASDHEDGTESRAVRESATVLQPHSRGLCASNWALLEAASGVVLSLPCRSEPACRTRQISHRMSVYKE